MGTRFIASSPRMREAVARSDAIARGQKNVLILGECGTGRLRVARRVHKASGRKGYVTADFTEAAFADVITARERWEALSRSAYRGTLILRHLDRLPDRVAAALRHSLRSPDQVRIVITSAVPLADTALDSAGRNYDCIELPALRERVDDMAELLVEFIEVEAAGLGVAPPAVAAEVLDAVEGYGWTGNLTELRAVVRRALLVTKRRERIEVADLPVALRRAARDVEAGGLMTIEELTKRAILDAFDRLDGRRAAMARALGLSVRTLTRKMRAYGIGRGRQATAKFGRPDRAGRPDLRFDDSEQFER